MTTDIQWEEVEGAQGSFAKFETPGDTYMGTVVAYNATSGASDFDGNDCGYLVLEDTEGDLWTITLDKGALRDKVAAANPYPGLLIQVAFSGWAESKKTGRQYKTFSVKKAAGRPPTTKKTPTRKPVEPDEAPF